MRAGAPAKLLQTKTFFRVFFALSLPLSSRLSLARRDRPCGGPRVPQSSSAPRRMPVSMSGSPLGVTRSPPPQQGDLLMAAKAKNQAARPLRAAGRARRPVSDSCTPRADPSRRRVTWRRQTRAISICATTRPSRHTVRRARARPSTWPPDHRRLRGNTRRRWQLRQKQLEQKRANDRPVGVRGARVGEVNAAKKLICDRLIEKNATVRKALKDLDESGDGILSREEIKKFLREQNMLKYFDFYTGQTRGDLDPKVVDTLLDMVDANEDGNINYEEFSNVVMEAAN